MAIVAIAPAAVEDLERLMLTLTLPADTRSRVVAALQMLETFPLVGAQLGGTWAEYRFVLGPWRWMVLVYEYDEETDRVVVVTVQDTRSSSAATAS